jgi:hypothetical protein
LTRDEPQADEDLDEDDEADADAPHPVASLDEPAGSVALVATALCLAVLLRFDSDLEPAWFDEELHVLRVERHVVGHPADPHETLYGMLVSWSRPVRVSNGSLWATTPGWRSPFQTCAPSAR